MGTVLLILKIVGLVLLSVLALVFLLLCLVLFVPVRYRGKLKKDGEFRGVVAASYLLRIVDFRLEFGGEETVPELRIFWFFRKKPAFGPKDAGEKPEDEEEEEKKEKEKVPFREKVEALTDRAKKVLKLIDNDRVHAALSVTFRKVKSILRSILPKRISGEAEFGLSDPYKTAKALSYMAVLMPLHKNAVEIRPDFEHEVFTGDLRFRGRVLVAALLFYALTLYFNRDVQYTLKKVKKYFGKKKEAKTNG